MADRHSHAVGAVLAASVLTGCVPLTLNGCMLEAGQAPTTQGVVIARQACERRFGGDSFLGIDSDIWFWLGVAAVIGYFWLKHKKPQIKEMLRPKTEDEKKLGKLLDDVFKD